MNKKRLIELLLECPSLRSAETRHSLLTLLPPDIATQVKASDIAKIHVLNIVNTCMDYPDGIKILLENVGFFDDKTEPFQRLIAKFDPENELSPSFPDVKEVVQPPEKVRFSL